MDKLLPCPFCGSENNKLFYDEQQDYHVECYGCGKTVSYHITGLSSRKIAAEIYNRRHKPENNPLTWDEFIRTEAEPVWIVDEDGECSCEMLYDVIDHPCEGVEVIMRDFYGHVYNITKTSYSKTWLAYRRKPENVTSEEE